MVANAWLYSSIHICLSMYFYGFGVSLIISLVKMLNRVVLLYYNIILIYNLFLWQLTRGSAVFYSTTQLLLSTDPILSLLDGGVSFCRFLHDLE
jgi:hypothetical protein